jgi:hypothetical protein
MLQLMIKSDDFLVGQNGGLGGWWVNPSRAAQTVRSSAEGYCTPTKRLIHYRPLIPLSEHQKYEFFF